MLIELTWLNAHYIEYIEYTLNYAWIHTKTEQHTASHN